MTLHPSRPDVIANGWTPASGFRRVTACILLLLALAAGAAAMLGDAKRIPAPAGQFVEVTINRPAMLQTNEGIEVTVPNGTAASYSASGHGFSLPPVIRMRTGQHVRVRNEDSLTHVILGLRVAAGETVSRFLERPGYEVYSAGCAAHAAAPEMTTLIVSDADNRGETGGS